MFTRTKYGEENGLYNYSEFVCENISDIASLPTSTTKSEVDGEKYNICAIGSIATIIDTTDVYILSPSNEWVKLYNVGGGSSGGGTEVDPYVIDVGELLGHDIPVDYHSRESYEMFNVDEDTYTGMVEACLANRFVNVRISLYGLTYVIGGYLNIKYQQGSSEVYELYFQATDGDDITIIIAVMNSDDDDGTKIGRVSIVWNDMPVERYLKAGVTVNAKVYQDKSCSVVMPESSLRDLFIRGFNFAICEDGEVVGYARPVEWIDGYYKELVFIIDGETVRVGGSHR